MRALLVAGDDHHARCFRYALTKGFQESLLTGAPSNYQYPVHKGQAFLHGGYVVLVTFITWLVLDWNGDSGEVRYPLSIERVRGDDFERLAAHVKISSAVYDPANQRLS